MLYKSGNNLFSGALEFISNSNEITLFSAYIKTQQLRKLDSLKKINRIIVRWEIRDLHQGASDLDLFEYCSENNIALFTQTFSIFSVLFKTTLALTPPQSNNDARRYPALATKA